MLHLVEMDLLVTQYLLEEDAVRKKRTYSQFFGPYFSAFLLRKSPYSVWMRENTH